MAGRFPVNMCSAWLVARRRLRLVLGAGTRCPGWNKEGLETYSFAQREALGMETPGAGELICPVEISKLTLLTGTEPNRRWLPLHLMGRRLRQLWLRLSGEKKQVARYSETTLLTSALPASLLQLLLSILPTSPPPLWEPSSRIVPLQLQGHTTPLPQEPTPPLAMAATYLSSPPGKATSSLSPSRAVKPGTQPPPLAQAAPPRGTTRPLGSPPETTRPLGTPPALATQPTPPQPAISQAPKPTASHLQLWAMDTSMGRGTAPRQQGSILGLYRLLGGFRLRLQRGTQRLLQEDSSTKELLQQEDNSTKGREPLLQEDSSIRDSGADPLLLDHQPVDTIEDEHWMDLLNVVLVKC